MSRLLTLLFSVLFFNASAQKFMIHGRDTLPYKQKMVINRDTTYDAYKHVFIKEDTVYVDECPSFEKINGKIVNRTDTNCSRKGLWIEKEGIAGNYWETTYNDDENANQSRFLFNKNNKLLREEQRIYDEKNEYLVKQIDYSQGKPLIIINKPFLKFTVKYMDNGWFIIPFILSFFVRLNLNSKIYNTEEGTDYVIRPRFATDDKGELDHLIRCAFTIWFFKYKSESRKLVIISNLMSIIFFCICTIEVLSIIELAH